MSQNLTLVFYLGCAIFLLSCQSNNKKGVSENGFRYVHHKDNEGGTPQVGEYAYYHLYIRNPETNKITYNSRDQEQIPRSAIVDPEQLKNKNPQPVLEALRMMSVGDSLTIFKDLKDMPRRPTGYETAAEVAYDIKLMEIKTEQEYIEEYMARKKAIQAKQAAIKAREPEVGEMVRNNAVAYLQGDLNDQLLEKENGLKYIIHEEGNGELPKHGQTISAFYYGALKTGAMFDNNFRKGTSYKFQLGRQQVIRGWDLAFANFPVGTKATLFIPSALGYGKKGNPPNIPGDSDLVFYVEMEDIQ